MVTPPAAQETAVETTQSLQALLGRPSKGETSFAKRVNEGDGVRRRLYEYILTRSHLLGSPLRAAPNLTVTAVYTKLSRALVLPKSQCEINATSTPASRPPQ